MMCSFVSEEIGDRYLSKVAVYLIFRFAVLAMLSDVELLLVPGGGEGIRWLIDLRFIGDG